VLRPAGAAPEAAPSPKTGQVLLLDNERIVEGDIVRQGDRYRVKRDFGESWIPADKVIRLCATRADAYQCLRSRANLRDIDERLRLARWCHLHGLREQGLAETKAALELKADCKEAERMLRCFEASDSPQVKKETPTTDKPATSDESQESGAQSASAGAIPPTALAALPALSMEASAQFSLRVQPILMNACVACHASERGGSFRLMPTYDRDGNHRATQHNLAAAIAQINAANPTASPLLVKAGSVHGTLTQPPLKGRQLPAYHALEEWVKMVVVAMPEAAAVTQAPAETATGIFHSGTTGSPAEKASEPAESEWAVGQKGEAEKTTSSPPSPAAKPEEVVELPKESAKPKEPESNAREVPHAPSATPPPRPPPPQPVDEFDPLHFNRIAHPERVGGETK
jgi:hypothetical protein